VGPVAAALAVLALAPGSAVAGPALYSVGSITNNSPTDSAIGAAQVHVEVIDAGGGNVTFRFTNSGPLASSIMGVYFDDSSLLGTASISSSAGVSFSAGGSPTSLPGGKTINFNTTQWFTANPGQANGVNPGESLDITFHLANNATYGNILAALDLAYRNPGVDMVGGLRIGIKVQGFADGGSESFLLVPEPSSIALALSGLVALSIAGAGRLRRRVRA
jgi:hypothetical protein